jgi:hypothetical protein
MTSPLSPLPPRAGRSALQAWLAALLLIIVSLIGTVVILLAAHFDPAQFFTEIGIALVIAGVVGLVVELYSKHMLFREVAEQSAAALAWFETDALDLVSFQRLPLDIREGIRAQVLRQRLVERDKDYAYTFELVERGGVRAAKVNFTIRTTYEHLYHDEEIVTIRQSIPALAAQLTAVVDDYGFHAVTPTVLLGNCTLTAMGRGNIEPFVAPNPELEEMSFTKEERLSGGGSVRVVYEGVLYFDLEDWMYIEVALPTLGMSVSAGGDDFVFRASPGDVLRNATWNADSVKGVWRIGGVALPGQGVQLRWEHSDAAASDETP